MLKSHREEAAVAETMAAWHGHADEAQAGSLESVPTPGEMSDVPDTWRRIWSVMADPSNLNKTVIALAELADVSRSTWYEITNKPEFDVFRRRAMLAAVGQRMGSVLNTLIFSALIPGREGSTDRRVVLEMTDYYQPGAAAARERSKKDGEAAKTAGMDDQSLAELAKEMGVPIPPGIARRLNLDLN